MAVDGDGGMVSCLGGTSDAAVDGDGVGSADLDRSTLRRSARFLRGGETTEAVDGDGVMDSCLGGTNEEHGNFPGPYGGDTSGFDVVHSEASVGPGPDISSVSDVGAVGIAFTKHLIRCKACGSGTGQCRKCRSASNKKCKDKAKGSKRRRKATDDVDDAPENIRFSLFGKLYDAASILRTCASCGRESGIGEMFPACLVKRRGARGPRAGALALGGRAGGADITVLPRPERIRRLGERWKSLKMKVNEFS